MDKKLVAKATITINAPTSKVWDALTKPDLIKQYLFLDFSQSGDIRDGIQELLRVGLRN